MKRMMRANSEGNGAQGRKRLPNCARRRFFSPRSLHGEKGDRSPLILPSTVPIDDQRIQFELTRYLSDNWVPIIEKDEDGPNSLPLRIDSDVPNLGKVSATRRVARAIYLGSARPRPRPIEGLKIDA